MRDILPRERAIWRVAEKAAADVAARFGYAEIVTPVVEHAELIERVGEDTDAVAKELYRFDDRGGRNLALRPEATASSDRSRASAPGYTSKRTRPDSGSAFWEVEMSNERGDARVPPKT